MVNPGSEATSRYSDQLEKTAPIVGSAPADAVTRTRDPRIW